MVKTYEIKFSLLILISIFLHIIIIFGIISPNFHDLIKHDELKRNAFSGGRDIIVNINQDNKRVISRKTLLSDKDSTARGYITVKRGNRWLNNSLDFRMLLGSNASRRSGSRSKTRDKEKFILNDKSEVVVMLNRSFPKKSYVGKGGFNYKMLIPDKNDVTMKNAIFYTNTGNFSFNTAKFKNFQYFKSMKDKIASNWNVPGLGNNVLGVYDPISGRWTYAPGWTRVMAFPSQHVKLVFLMNRKGDVVGIKILDSLGNAPLDQSCVDAIRLSKNFGKVPKDIKGEVVVIPFIFGYYAY
ncbi:energy transducer TonB [Spirochaetota bacterium]